MPTLANVDAFTWQPTEPRQRVPGPAAGAGGYALAVTERLAKGAPAPAFTLPDQQGTPVSLADYAGRQVLVYFYPKADTPGCTAQACGTTAVVGISPDTPKKQAAFDAKYGLGFPLLADTEHSVAQAYGVWVERSMYGRRYMGIERSAFLVGPDGLLQEVWYKVSPSATTANLLTSLGLA
jgi:peroxiredoxin Q/BCP